MINTTQHWPRNRRSARRIKTSISAWHDDHRKIGHGAGIDLTHRHDTLLTSGRPLHVPGVGEPAGLPQRLAYASEGPAQFHDRCRIGVGDPTRELWHRQRSGQHRQNVFMPREWCPQRSRGGRQ
jgi:hypothetical protein